MLNDYGILSPSENASFISTSANSKSECVPQAGPSVSNLTVNEANIIKVVHQEKCSSITLLFLCRLTQKLVLCM